MIKILAIGNSFSQDATAYLHNIAKADGIDTKVVNLYIGGCSLETHWNNITNNSSAYDYELNGQKTGRIVSILEALEEESWDYITLQQVSSDSGRLETYYPFITQIHDYVKNIVPQAQQLIHQTWAYEIDSNHSAFIYYGGDQSVMYRALTNAYEQVAEELSLQLILCGKVIQTLRRCPAFDYANGGISLCRDGFHMNLIYGRYAVAAVWYEFLLRRSILNNPFTPPVTDGVITDEGLIRLIKETVHRIVEEELMK